jgi:hypothetical protein
MSGPSKSAIIQRLGTFADWTWPTRYSSIIVVPMIRAMRTAPSQTRCARWRKRVAGARTQAAAEKSAVIGILHSTSSDTKCGLHARIL